MNRPIQHTRNGFRRRAGIALLLVITVLAIATVLGYAMLSTNTLQAEISSNLQRATIAEYAAESGINVAMYYLQNPTVAPASWTANSNYMLSATGVPLNDGSQAVFDVTVTANPLPNSYTIQSTGWPSAGSSFSHVASAVVTANPAPIPAALVAGGNITIPTNTTITSNGSSDALAIQANGSINLQAGSNITGSKSAAPLASDAYIVPTSATVNHYGVGTSGGTYLWTDNTTIGTPQQITSSSLTSATLPAKLPSNPAGIYYCVGNLNVTGSTTINGTLIVTGGNLTVSSHLTINPASQFPAMICDQKVMINGAGRVCTCNGVVFLGTGLAWNNNNSNSSFNVNGALLLAAGANIAYSTYGASVVSYSPTSINVPLLTTFNQPALSITPNTWVQ
jgi:hypothetical protein